MRLPQRVDEKPVIPIAPMIDCVFLLLIYFMLTSSLEKQEMDLSFSLPVSFQSSSTLDLPSEQIIVMDDFGQVFVNGYPCDSPTAIVFTELTSILMRFKEECDANQKKCSLSIAPSRQTSHQSIVKLMDAISITGIEQIGFVEL